MIRTAVDFNTMTMDPQERVWIPASAAKRLADCHRPGLPVLLYDETLEVEAIAEFDEADNGWWARPDQATYRDVPDPEPSARRAG